MKRFPKILILLFSFTALFGLSCNNEERIPYVEVNIQLYLNMAEFQDLKIPGNWAYITGGVRGIIVFCANSEEYYAYERNCPYQPSNDSARIFVDETNIFAECEHCGSKFNLYDGYPVSGEASLPLTQYSTSLENDILYIYNRY